MKKNLLLIVLGLSLNTYAQEFQPMHGDQHNTMQGPGGSGVLFANDVAIAPSVSLRQHGTSISVAFNGWIYEATGLETMDSDSSGGLVRYSRDNGFTWLTLVSFLYPGVDYLQPEIEVTGTDTNSLYLFIASAWYDTTTLSADVWVDKYNATNGMFINEVYNEALQYPVRDVDLASDYKFPAWMSSPYSIGLLYSHYGSTDSLIFVSSGDAGVTWGNRTGVAGTAGYMDQVSLAFGISSNWSNGRYFAAWEDRTSFSAAAVGKIKTAHCISVFNGAWTSPRSLDSLDPGVSGVARRPRIACLYNNTVTNDSSGLTVAVIFERAYGGDTADCDIIGFYSKSQPSSNYWSRFDVVNNSYQTLQPDIEFDPAYNNFLLTFFNRSQQQMPYLVHDFNMINPATWVVITPNYCDQPATLKDPFPRVTINPVLTQAAFSWTRIATGPTREQAMFDAEYASTGIIAVSSPQAEMNLYPNPAQNETWLTFYMQTEQRVTIDIYSMDGKRVMNVLDQTIAEGPQRILIPTTDLANGMYLAAVSYNGETHSVQMIVNH